MKQFVFYSIFLFIFFVYFGGGYAKVVRINLDDINEFRARNYVEAIDTLSDLNPKAANVSEILERIQKLEKECNEVLFTVPDNGNACFLIMKYRLAAIVERAKELSDLCIARNLNIEKQLELNENQQKCLDDILNATDIEKVAMKTKAEECKLKF